jgi:GNAT superfamily N-acetyltransferase
LVRLRFPVHAEKISHFTIREATPKDASKIVELMRELAAYEKLEHLFVSTEEDLKEWLFATPVVGSFVAELEGMIVGYAIFYRSFSTFAGKPCFWLEDLYVSPDARANGIGKALLRKLASHTVRSKHARLEWAVLDWNDSAIEFYKSLGAEVMPDWRLCRLSGESLELLGSAHVADENVV